MIVEAIIWTTAALVAPDIIGLVRAGWGGGSGERLQTVVSFGRWFRSLGIPYLALLSGAVAARDVGLSGQTGAEWLRGAFECAGVLGLTWIVIGYRRTALSYSPPVRAAMDEGRWALYRGTGSLLADPLWAGPLIGLAVGLIEWAVKHHAWVQPSHLKVDAWSSLARVCGSTALFLLTRNLWLIVVTQAGLSLIIGGAAREPNRDQT